MKWNLLQPDNGTKVCFGFNRKSEKNWNSNWLSAKLQMYMGTEKELFRLKAVGSLQENFQSKKSFDLIFYTGQ